MMSIFIKFPLGIFLVYVITTETLGCGNLVFVSRDAWGARPPVNQTTAIPPANMTFIHHSDGANCSTRAECDRQCKIIQDHHMDVKGYNDIGYNFLIGGDGAVYEGRGWQVQGAHAPGFNSMSHGICFIGDYESQIPTSEAITSAKDLMACGVTSNHIKTDFELFGHKKLISETTCPGDSLDQEIQSWPHYSSRGIE